MAELVVNNAGIQICTKPNSRNTQNVVTTKCGTETHRVTFIPSTKRL